MSVIVMGFTKGGVGKTTSAVQVSTTAALDGRRILLVNGDRQKSGSNSAIRRSQFDLMPSMDLVEYPDGKDLRAGVLAQRDQYDDVIIDVGGRDSSALRDAMMIADVMLVPVEPSDYALDALTDEMVPLIRKVQADRVANPLPVYAFLNKARPQRLSARNQAARKAIEAIPELQLLQLMVTARDAIGDASARGQSVREYTPRDPKAIREIDALVKALFE